MTSPDIGVGPVAVVGAGLTGASWAALFAAHGREVRLYGRDGDAARAALPRVREAVEFLVSHDLAPPQPAQRGLRALRVESDIASAVAGVVLVQESVAEDLAVKRAVFAEADAAAPPDAILATSSSGLSISRIQEGLPGAARCVAAHPYNPPHLIPLVEIAPGMDTSPEAVETARIIYESVGKDPVVLARDLPGYLSNRMSAALWREAVELVRSGVASVADVDRAIASGPGLRWAAMGPHTLYHLGGGAGGMRGHIEHLGHVKEGMLRDIATWTEFPADTTDILEAGLVDALAGRSAASLERERDEALAGFLKARAAAASSGSQTPAANGAPTGGVEQGAALATGGVTQAPPVPIVVQSAAGVAVQAAPGVTRTTLAAGSRTTLVRFELEPGADIPLHAHPHEQTGHLVSGDAELVGVDGSWSVRPGDSWSIPGDAPHGARSVGGAVIVEAFSPPRDDYLPAPPSVPPTGQPSAPPSEPAG
ncbi:MAG: cupin domain-containing protein [Actinobacteria bacterium]|nr:cupin domain-containing protein [Actinomycetota bacterium]